jgi:hypothetical protein
MNKLKVLTKCSLFIAILYLGGCSSNEPPNNWRNLSYKEKQEWIEWYLKSPSDLGYQLIETTNNAIQSNFSSTETIEWDPWGGATFVNAYVVDADNGWVFTKGKCSVENAFGQRVVYSYQVKWKITPKELSLLKADVTLAN